MQNNIVKKMDMDLFGFAGKSKKQKEAATFKAKKLIMDVNADKLLQHHYRVSTSNFMKIMDQFDEFTRK